MSVLLFKLILMLKLKIAIIVNEAYKDENFNVSRKSQPAGCEGGVAPHLLVHHMRGPLMDV